MFFLSGEEGQIALAKASAEEAAAFDKAFQPEMDRAALCPRAERCCVSGTKLLGAECDPKAELGDAGVEGCKEAVVRIREQLAAAKKPVPAECR